MVSKKWNQFRQAMMNEEKPDTEKIIKINSMILHELGLVPQREQIFLFSKEDGHLVKISPGISEKEYHHHIIHVPDIMLYINSTLWVIEIDGLIHDQKQFVAFKDKIRDECYNRASLHWIKINESEVLYKLGIREKRKASPDEIWQILKPQLQEIIENQRKDLLG